jgi:hypothetical protein
MAGYGKKLCVVVYVCVCVCVCVCACASSLLSHLSHRARNGDGQSYEICYLHLYVR